MYHYVIVTTLNAPSLIYYKISWLDKVLFIQTQNDFAER